MTKSASLDKHIWKLYDHVNIKHTTIRNDLPPSSEFSNEEFDMTCSHSALTMQCRVSRKPGYFIINCLLPTLMITLCVFFTFLMDYQRFQYRFSLLFTTILTSITFRWAIHGRVLPTISYMTFLDVYCVSSIMVVFSAMIWHACWLILYKQDVELAERCDTYAMITFAIFVIITHFVQTIWFIIAFKKRLDLEKLDKQIALSYLKARTSSGSGGPMNGAVIQQGNKNNGQILNKVNSSASLPPAVDTASAFQSNSLKKTHFKTIQSDSSFNNSASVKSKRMLYSLSKMEDNSVITIHNNSDTSDGNHPVNILNEDPKWHIKMTRNESNMTCNTTLSNQNNNFNHVTSNNVTNTREDGTEASSGFSTLQNPNNSSNNIKLLNKSNSFLNSSNSNSNFSPNSNSASSSLYNVQNFHHHALNPHSSTKIRRPTGAPVFDHNKLNVSQLGGIHYYAGCNSGHQISQQTSYQNNNNNNLDYHYIPLVQQTSRDS